MRRYCNTDTEQIIFLLLCISLWLQVTHHDTAFGYRGLSYLKDIVSTKLYDHTDSYALLCPLSVTG